MQRTRIPTPARTILPLAIAATFLAVSTTCAHPLDNYFPLDKGTFWEYDADLEYTAGDSSKAPVTVEKLHLRYKVSVIDRVDGDGNSAALLDGYPSDLAWYEPGDPHRKCIIFRAGPNNYFRLTENIDALWSELKSGKLDTWREELTGDSLILQAPLVDGARFGDYSQTPRTRYCWVVEGSSSMPAEGIPGVSATTNPVYTIAQRTSPEHTFIEFLPGTGIVAYEYGHHGTVANARLALVRFGRESAAP